MMSSDFLSSPALYRLTIFDESELKICTELIKEATTDHAKNADLMALSNDFRNKFHEMIPEKEAQKDIVNFLNQYVSDCYFTALYFQLPTKIIRFVLFAEMIADKHFKKGSASLLKDHLKNLLFEKRPVRYRGIITSTTVNEPPPPPRGGKGGERTEQPRASIPEVMDDLRNVFQITDEELLLINEVFENVVQDDDIVTLIINNIDNRLFLESYRNTLKQRIVNYYLDHNWDERLFEGPHVSPGGIIEYIFQAAFILCRSKAA